MKGMLAEPLLSPTTRCEATKATSWLLAQGAASVTSSNQGWGVTRAPALSACGRPRQGKGEVSR